MNIFKEGRLIDLDELKEKKVKLFSCKVNGEAKDFFVLKGEKGNRDFYKRECEELEKQAANLAIEYRTVISQLMKLKDDDIEKYYEFQDKLNKSLKEASKVHIELLLKVTDIPKEFFEDLEKQILDERSWNDFVYNLYDDCIGIIHESDDYLKIKRERINNLEKNQDEKKNQI